ncbi:XTP/dITP diphosphatase [Clostridium tagluense]|uniref:XTP/dITP diphosphatase n=1 Tax=Clostridium TaxID=1485 RepID=UPI0013E91D29|nr:MULTISPECIES: XTP/dITP diphosphatase [Clostridium]MBU3127063.1 XTP/dITP diphosphatase [Clostridium tagluense]MBW9158077.1 XTP/dITP diphosphatase [Clostridium tagluense]MBZ9625276.1 XTP/dITP diphosphatase [Clostridium sp. FP2]MCB2311064.1 XTP/dITP diphosphatase [Clostridium tagluense]MCB2316922.1 XTP/dITP diphosphatase [Clostridium tagluense]
MKKLIVASNNEHKIIEIKEMLSQFPFEVLSLKEAKINIDVEETGSTFMDNAEIKASEIFKIADGNMVLADDSGLSVESLNGEPGVFSARFAGVHGDTKANNEKLLYLLDGAKESQRKAKFICAMVLIVNEDKIVKVQGEVEGMITAEFREEEGFGYDPLFFVKEFNKTFAQISTKQKNSISHRGRALDKLKSELEKLI